MAEISESEDSGKIIDLTADSRRTIDLTGDSEIQKTLNSYSIPKIAKKNFKKGSRRKNLLKNVLSNNSDHRRCPPRTKAQQGNLDCHNRISLNFENSRNNNFKPIWYPNDLKCRVYNIKCNKHNQLESHFSSNKHKISMWNCTPKYCVPCGIYWAFEAPQLWEAHISSKKHNNRIGDKIPSVYGFIN